MIGRQPTFSVSEFVAVFNQSIDIAFPSVIIVGELANYRISKGAWVYFDLKDEEASVKFFGAVRALPGPLEDGMMVEVQGRPYLHPKFGFSVQMSSIVPVGKGSLKQAKDLLALKLKTEGLFDESRKRQIPYPPTRIGLISSVESAGYSDFIKIVGSRWPFLQVTAYDVLVQGKDAPEQIIQALSRANQDSELDAIVLVRGGGSADDLAAFDHELVVRAVATSRIPTMIAIGHERDVSLAELASDRRASTPSNAAELLVPDRLSERDGLKLLRSGVSGLLVQKLQFCRQDLRQSALTLDDGITTLIDRRKSDLNNQKLILGAANPINLLKKGYLVARSHEGKIVRSAKQAKEVHAFSLQFTDDTIEVSTK